MVCDNRWPAQNIYHVKHREACHAPHTLGDFSRVLCQEKSTATRELPACSSIENDQRRKRSKRQSHASNLVPVCIGATERG